jgi:Kef-type K+ transport system membrane component KefB
VFAIGALLLLGGAAAYLSLSAVFAGFVAGVFWHAAGRAARDRITHDLAYLQHPLIALLLILAGARVHLTLEVAGLVAVYLVCRTTGKLLGGWFASIGSGGDVPRDLGLSLMAPGIVGIAFALNVVQARGEADNTATLFAIVIAGSLASDVISLFVRGPEHPA